jgi:hypothetical protein
LLIAYLSLTQAIVEEQLAFAKARIKKKIQLMIEYFTIIDRQSSNFQSLL